MSRAQSTKPAKPYADFPLFPHATGRWAKKIRGKLVYFGPWADADAALAKYLSERDDLHAGRTPREAAEALTVAALCATFLTSKTRLLDAGELSPLTFAEYADCCRRIIDTFGKRRLVSDLRPDDFEKLRASFAKAWGPSRLGKYVGLTCTLFRYAAKNAMVAAPVVIGDGFRRPSRKVMLLHKHARGPQLFEAAEIHAMLAAASPALRAMILLGVNCAFGNNDCATLPRSAIDLTGGWVNFPRPKTGVARRCPLWPETVTAVRDWLAVRPEPHGAADGELLFLATRGNSVSTATGRLLDKLGIDGHRNFYALRHTCQTVADESGDFVAVRSVMGHAFGNDISGVYRERISDERLKKVTDVVRRWLFEIPQNSV